MNYFVVFQGKTFKQEHKEGILWAPAIGKKGGKPYFHWENMTKCNVGDVVKIMETRPLSKNKNWRLVEIVEKAK